MAKFAPYYGLCPLIDCKSLLGISEDAEYGNVVVTLGKNIAIKYKLSNQKQLNSWRTKEKFSSPVIYAKDLNKYVAVFNHTNIRLWTGEEDEHLDKIKKFKFNHKIHTLLHLNGITFVVFTNGKIYPLDKALEERKTFNPANVFEVEENIDEILTNVFMDNSYIGFLVKSSNDIHFYWTIVNKHHSTDIEFSKINVARKGDCTLIGSVLHNTPNVSFITAWSDNKVFCTELQQSKTNNSIGELFTMMDLISGKHRIVMTSLNENYLAVHGASANEEGALLIIFNSQFKVNQTKQPFKLYTLGTQLWRIDNNLLLPVGQNLAVVPFCLETEQLAALIGSHKGIEQDPDIAIIEELATADWGNDESNDMDDLVPTLIKKKMLEIGKLGITEAVLLESLLVDVFEKKDLVLLKTCLEYFCDISEKCLSKILSFLLKLESKSFSNKQRETGEDFPEEMQPKERSDIVNIVLSKSYSDVQLFSHLRTDLDIDQVIVLLEYFHFLYTNEQNPLSLDDSVKNDKKLISWCSILLDSNYQKLLLTKDQKIVDILVKLNEVVTDDLILFKDFNETESVLTQFIQQKGFSQIGVHLKYSVEQLSLY